MKRTTRASLTLLAAVTTALAGAVALAPAADAEDPIDVGSVAATDTVIRAAANAVDAAENAPVKCTPTWMAITIHWPTYTLYTGLADWRYDWSVDVEAEEPVCKSVISLTARLTDQAMDGGSPPTTGQPSAGSGQGWVGVAARHSVPYLHTDLGLHELTVHFVASVYKTSLFCSGTKTWHYRPTRPDPLFEGSSPTQIDDRSTIACYPQ